MIPVEPFRSSPEGCSLAVQMRLCQLFRHSLRTKRIHPLYEAMLKYRLARPAPEPR